jgi:hypothetical protein
MIIPDIVAFTELLEVEKEESFVMSVVDLGNVKGSFGWASSKMPLARGMQRRLKSNSRLRSGSRDGAFNPMRF